MPSDPRIIEERASLGYPDAIAEWETFQMKNMRPAERIEYEKVKAAKSIAEAERVKSDLFRRDWADAVSKYEASTAPAGANWNDSKRGRQISPAEADSMFLAPFRKRWGIPEPKGNVEKVQYFPDRMGGITGFSSLDPRTPIPLVKGTPPPDKSKTWSPWDVKEDPNDADKKTYRIQNLKKNTVHEFSSAEDANKFIGNQRYNDWTSVPNASNKEQIPTLDSIIMPESLRPPTTAPSVRIPMRLPTAPQQGPFLEGPAQVIPRGWIGAKDMTGKNSFFLGRRATTDEKAALANKLEQENPTWTSREIKDAVNRLLP